jgi:hypothetical protein
MQRKVVGIGMMHLRRADFLGYAIPVPDESVQIAVAAYLDWIENGVPVGGAPVSGSRSDCRLTGGRGLR